MLTYSETTARRTRTTLLDTLIRTLGHEDCRVIHFAALCERLPLADRNECQLIFLYKDLMALPR